MRIALVTPYYKEPTDVLRRCHESVSRQTVPAIHYMVADGIPNREVDGWDVRHIALPENIGNSGATPRGIAAITAFAEGADAVSFLDADNWVYPDHVARIEAAMASDPEFIHAVRRIFFPDGDELYRELGDKVIDDRVADSNCFVFVRRAAFMAPLWAMYPTQFGAGEDNLFGPTLGMLGLRKVHTGKPTVHYLTNWLHHYRRAGKQPILGVRTPSTTVLERWNRSTYHQFTGLDLPLGGDMGPPLPPIDPKSPKVALVSLTDIGTGATSKESCEAILGSVPTNVSLLLVGQEPPRIEGEERITTLTLPRFEPGIERPPAYYESIAAIFAFQRGFDVVVFMLAGSESGASAIKALVDKAVRIRPGGNEFLVSADGRKIQGIPAGEPLDRVAVPRTIAGRFIQRNLARGVPGFEGRGWRRVLKGRA